MSTSTEAKSSSPGSPASPPVSAPVPAAEAPEAAPCEPAPCEPAPCEPARPHNRRLLLGAACSSLQPLLLSALMLPATAYVIRSLGPTGYGEWTTATSLIAVLVFMTNLGLRGTFVRAVAKVPETGPIGLAEQLGVRLLLALIAAGIGLVACLLLRYSHTVLLCTLMAAGALVLTTISTTAADLLQAYHRLPAVAMVNMVAGLVLTGASVAAAWMGFGPVVVASTYIIGPAVSTAILFWLIQRQHFPIRVRWDFRRFGRLLWDARYIAAHQLMDSTSGRAEGLIVPRLVGPTLFGFFSAGTLLATRGMTVPEGLCSAAYPSLVDAYRRGPIPLIRTFGKFLALMMGSCIPAAVVVSLAAGPVARLLFPGRAELCEQVMRVTIWLLPVMGLEYIIGTGLGAMHKDAAQARAAFIGGVCNLLLTAALCWRFGVMGAAWSMVLRYVVKLIVLAPLVAQCGRQLLAEAAAARAQSDNAAAVVPGVALS